MKKLVPEVISSEVAPVSEITIFKVYQTREDVLKDYPGFTSFTDAEWFDPNIPEKYWLDPDARADLISGNPFNSYTYKVIAQGGTAPSIKSITLPAMIAGRVNIPPKKGANEIPPNSVAAKNPPVPVPIRDLAPEEILEYVGPMMSVVVVNTKIRYTNRLNSDGFFAGDRKILLEILEKLDKLMEKYK